MISRLEGLGPQSINFEIWQNSCDFNNIPSKCGLLFSQAYLSFFIVLGDAHLKLIMKTFTNDLITQSTFVPFQHI